MHCNQQINELQIIAYFVLFVGKVAGFHTFHEIMNIQRRIFTLAIVFTICSKFFKDILTTYEYIVNSAILNIFFQSTWTPFTPYKLFFIEINIFTIFSHYKIHGFDRRQLYIPKISYTLFLNCHALYLLQLVQSFRHREVTMIFWLISVM